MAAASADLLHAVALRPTVRSRLALAWWADGPTAPAARVLLTEARHHLLDGD